MLREDRRMRRIVAGMLVTVTALALIWPASIAAGRAPSPAAAATVAANGAPHKTTKSKQPTVHSLGVQSLEANKGGAAKRTKPLKHLSTPIANRGDLSATSGGARSQAAPIEAAAAPAAVQATQNASPAAFSASPYDGIGQANTGNLEPPDPWIAVGPDDLVQTTNAMLRFSNREGTATAGSIQLFDFFAFDELVPGDPNYIDGIGDPRWIYDAKHNRWMGITLAWHCDRDGAGANDDSLGFVWGAISLSGDPTGDYYQFYVLYNTFLPDFPALGTSADKFSISANEFILTDQADCTAGIDYDGASVMTFDWAQMLTSPPLPDGTYEFDNTWFALRPALSPQSQSNTIVIVGEKLLPSPAGDTASNVVYMTVTGTNASGTGTVLSAERDLTALSIVPEFVDPPDPIQPGGALAAGIVDRRPTDAIFQDSLLTFTSTVPCDPAGGGAETRDCARITQLNTTTPTPTRVQDMLIATSGKDTWFPGVGVSQSGILHVVYTESSSTEGMGSFDRYQLRTDAKHTVSAAVEIADGGANAYGGDRWGDFVGVAQDPRDTNAVWQANQYSHSGGTWATRVSELQTTGATFKPIAPVRVLDSRANIGTVGPFTANVAKTINIAGANGIPNNAVAITGNLTVTSQEAAGYGAITVLPTANPTSSTLNFPVKDNRANNVTMPLSTTGDVSIVYKAVAGKRTHFVLDVTGYFVNDATGATYTPLAPIRIIDTRATTPLAANLPRQIPIRGVQTVPANAIAVTGNVAVTNQTSGGFIAITTDQLSNPSTSTLNFPLGDVRANGFTIKLNASGSVWAVAKVPAGKTAHIVLDVTGYYVQDLNGARFVPVTPGRRMDSRGSVPPLEGLVGPFVANTARTLVIEPYQGVPGNATAITGNLTVVGQTQAGYVAMTQIATNTPPTSTLNFPLGDIRANGVTGPLSGPGSVGLVYKAGGGRTTHLILDITGYFR